MRNTIETLHEATRNGKTLRRLADQTNKARMHRYERRKIRNFIRMGDWNEDDSN